MATKKIVTQDDNNVDESSTYEDFDDSPQERREKALHSYSQRMKQYVVGLLLRMDFNVFVPRINDSSIDCVIRRQNGTFVEVQIKARSANTFMGLSGFFSGIPHNKEKINHKNYYYVFYSERLDLTWIMSGEEFLSECTVITEGRDKGKCQIRFTDKMFNEAEKQWEEYAYEKFDKYLSTDLERFESFRLF